MMIIKIGGGKSINIEGIASDLTKIDDELIILHGANSYRDELAERMEIDKKIITSVSGYQSVASTEEIIDLMMMSYAGLRNKRIVEKLQQYDINAVGLTGIDGKLIRGQRNQGIRIIENGKKKIFRDLSGKPKEINTHLLNILIDGGYIPVITVPIIDKKAIAINSENDDILTQLSKVMSPETVISFIEAPGLLKDPNDVSSVIKTVDKDELNKLEHTMEGRIKRKLYAIKKLVNVINVRLLLADGRVEHPVINAMDGNATEFL